MSSDNSTARITRRSIADAFDTYDDQITAVNNAKLNDLRAYRDQLSGQGYTPAGIKAEIEACKAAIQKRRAAAWNQQAVEERHVLVDEIYEEISSSRAPLATHAREDEAASLPAGDASSGESLDESANPDAVSQGHLSGPENGSGRSGRDLERQVNESFSMPIHIQLS